MNLIIKLYVTFKCIKLFICRILACNLLSIWWGHIVYVTYYYINLISDNFDGIFRVIEKWNVTILTKEKIGER